MECPRCVAERRAQWVRGTANLGFLLMIALIVAPCVLVMWLHMYAESYRYDPHSLWGRLNHREGDATQWSLTLALAVACGSLGLGAIARRVARSASTPPPAPESDPLATYREGGPVECPRHPFAR